MNDVSAVPTLVGEQKMTKITVGTPCGGTVDAADLKLRF
jgi:hypothetical protein